MTQKQKRQSLILKKAGVQMLSQKIEFKKAGDSEEAAAKLAMMKKLEAMNKKKILVIRTEPTTESEWRKEKQAGCTFWVHKTSGVIATKRPFEVEDDADSLGTPVDDSSSQFSNSHDEDFFTFLPEEDESPATGSIVYDPKPFDNLMKELDEMSH